MRRVLIVILAALSLSGCIIAARQVIKQVRKGEHTAAAAESGMAPKEVREALDFALKNGASGATAIAMKNGKQLFRLDVGEANKDTTYPVASASKWVTAALVMTVVDDGRLSLDAPISAWLPEFSGTEGKITLRELLAQTAGEGSIKSLVDIRQDARITLAQSAVAIARRPLEDPPGTVFKYGGPGFQVAGALVENVTGKRWAQLFDERMAKPLGMTHSHWVHLPARGATPEETRNPLLQGGLIMTADDYMRFLTMLAQNGMFGGRRILSEKAIDEMEQVQTLGLPKGYVPPGVKGDLQYAFGNWCARWDADRRCELALSPGAFGTFPWLDRKDGIYGIFFTKARLPKLSAQFRIAMAAIITANR